MGNRGKAWEDLGEVEVGEMRRVGAYILPHEADWYPVPRAARDPFADPRVRR